MSVHKKVRKKPHYDPDRGRRCPICDVFVRSKGIARHRKAHKDREKGGPMEGVPMPVVHHKLVRERKLRNSKPDGKCSICGNSIVKAIHGSRCDSCWIVYHPNFGLG